MAKGTAANDETTSIRLALPKGTFTFRSILLVVVLSMHPLGQGILRSLGFDLPFDSDQRTKVELDALERKVDNITERFDGLEKRFSSFEFTLSRIHENNPSRKQ